MKRMRERQVNFRRQTEKLRLRCVEITMIRIKLCGHLFFNRLFFADPIRFNQRSFNSNLFISRLFAVSDS